MEKHQSESMSPISDRTTISYKWPSIHVPNTSLARFIVEKFVFYSKQIFLVDGATKQKFLYHHVLLDSLRVVQVLRSKRVSSHTLGIIGGNDYEHVTTLLAALLMETTVVLLDASLTNEQITVAINKFNIDHLLVNRNKHVHIKDFKKQYQNYFSISFGNSICQESESVGHDSYLVSKIKPINCKHLGLNFIYNPANLKKTRLIVPQFRGRRLIKCYHIDEFSLLSQLTYAILPQCGFEWNINDRVLCMNPLSSLLGILELLAAFLVGAQIVINWRYRNQLTYTTEFCNLVQRYQITACILDSYYLPDLIKSNLTIGKSLKKLLYTRQPLHKNVVKEFKRRFNIHSCRFAWYLVETSGFAAIEVPSHEDDVSTSVTPLPWMQMLIVNRHSGSMCLDGKLGKVFVRSPYCAKSGQAKWRDGWIYSGFIGFSEDNTRLQVIDHYSNFLQLCYTFVSKTLIETILLSHPAVVSAVVLKHVDRHDKSFRALVQLEPREQCDANELVELIKTHLKENNIEARWRVCIVSGLRRDTHRNRIRTRRVRLRATTITIVDNHHIQSDSSTEYL